MLGPSTKGQGEVRVGLLSVVIRAHCVNPHHHLLTVGVLHGGIILRGRVLSSRDMYRIRVLHVSFKGHLSEIITTPIIIDSFSKQNKITERHRHTAVQSGPRAVVMRSLVSLSLRFNTSYWQCVLCFECDVHGESPDVSARLPCFGGGGP